MREENPEKISDVLGYLAEKTKGMELTEEDKTRFEAERQAAQMAHRSMEYELIEKLQKEENFGTKRAAVKEALETNGSALAKAFEDVTPEQRYAGNVVGAIAAANGKKDIEDAFVWAAVEGRQHGFPPLTWYEKGLFLFQAAHVIGVATPAGMRGVRKMFFVAKGDFSDESKIEMKDENGTERRLLRLLIKAKTNEDVEQAWTYAEQESGMGIRDVMKCFSFFQVLQFCEFDEKKFKGMVNVYLKMLN